MLAGSPESEAERRSGEGSSCSGSVMLDGEGSNGSRRPVCTDPHREHEAAAGWGASRMEYVVRPAAIRERMRTSCSS